MRHLSRYSISSNVMVSLDVSVTGFGCNGGRCCGITTSALVDIAHSLSVCERERERQRDRERQRQRGKEKERERERERESEREREDVHTYYMHMLVY